MFTGKYLALGSLMRNERRPPDEIVALQTRGLRRLVRHAYAHVPFYRARFDAAGVRPEDIRTAADLAALPVVDKQELIGQEGGAVPDPSIAKDRLVPRRTSGSSGIPFYFHVDRDYDSFCKAQYLRPYLTNGRGILKTAMRLTSHPSKRTKWFQRLGLMREHLVDCLTPGDEMRAVFSRQRPDLLIGYPSSISLLADAIAAGGRPVHQPQKIFTDSELLTGHAMRRIRAVFESPLIDVYGTFETDNIAWQCADGSAYHYAADCVILETLRDGRPVPAGEPGELVCTVLNSLAMPFIRYRLGDVASLAPGACACGRTLPLLHGIEGRTTDRMMLPGGECVSAFGIFNRINLLHDIVREYRITQHSRNAFSVLTVMRKDWPPDAVSRIREVFGATHPEARVAIEVVDEIPAGPSGKKRLFVSKIDG